MIRSSSTKTVISYPNMLYIIKMPKMSPTCIYVLYGNIQRSGKKKMLEK